MKHTAPIAILFACSAGLTAGCADRGNFPSLAPRPIELGTTAAVAAPPVTLSSNPMMVERASFAVRLAESGLAEFETALASARRAAAASDGNNASESWVSAQMALSQLERTRTPAATAMADLDDARRTLVMGAPSADTAVVEAAWARVQDIYRSQLESSQAVAASTNRR